MLPPLEKDIEIHEPRELKIAVIEPTSRSNVAPAGDPGVGASVEGALGGGQADRLDVGGERHRCCELQEGDVVVKRVRAVVGMIEDPRDPHRLLVGVGAQLALAAQVHGHAAGTDAAEDRGSRREWTRPTTELTCSYSPREAVGCAQHPSVVDEGASTAVAPGDVQAGLPGPAALGGDLSPHDPAVELRSSTLFGEDRKGKGQPEQEAPPPGSAL